jgi:hypothetical protein
MTADAFLIKHPEGCDWPGLVTAVTEQPMYQCCCEIVNHI